MAAKKRGFWNKVGYVVTFGWVFDGLAWMGRRIGNGWNSLWSSKKKTVSVIDNDPPVAPTIKQVSPRPLSKSAPPKAKKTTVTFDTSHSSFPKKKERTIVNVKKKQSEIRKDTLRKIKKTRHPEIIEEEIITLNEKINKLNEKKLYLEERHTQLIEKENWVIHNDEKPNEVHAMPIHEVKRLRNNLIQNSSDFMGNLREKFDQLIARRQALLNEKRISLLKELKALPNDIVSNVKDELEEIVTQLQTENSIYYTGTCATELEELRKKARKQGNKKLEKKLDIILDDIGLIILFNAKREDLIKQASEANADLSDSSVASPQNTKRFLKNALESPKKGKKPLKLLIAKEETDLVKLKTVVERKSTFDVLKERINEYQQKTNDLEGERKEQLYQLCKLIAVNYTKISEGKEQTISKEENDIIDILLPLNTAVVERALAIAIKQMLEKGDSSIIETLETIASNNTEEFLKIRLRNYINDLEDYNPIKTALIAIKEIQPEDADVMRVINKIKTSEDLKQQIQTLDTIINEANNNEPDRMANLLEKVNTYQNIIVFSFNSPKGHRRTPSRSNSAPVNFTSTKSSHLGNKPSLNNCATTALQYQNSVDQFISAAAHLTAPNGFLYPEYL